MYRVLRWFPSGRISKKEVQGLGKRRKMGHILNQPSHSKLGAKASECSAKIDKVPLPKALPKTPLRKAPLLKAPLLKALPKAPQKWTFPILVRDCLKNPCYWRLDSLYMGHWRWLREQNSWKSELAAQEEKFLAEDILTHNIRNWRAPQRWYRTKRNKA